MMHWRDLWAPRSLMFYLISFPMLLAIVYYSVLAQNRYVSTSMISVKRANQDSNAGTGLAMLISGGPSVEDSHYLKQYLHSLGLLNKLDAEMQLRQHYASAHSDPFFRIWPQASQEWWLIYWRSRVNLALDEVSGLLTIQVEGFDAITAKNINTALLREADLFINQITHRIAQEQMQFANSELARASAQLQNSQNKLLEFQTKHQILDPLAQAQASGTLSADLKGQLAKLETELATKRAYLQDDAPDIVALKSQVLALRQQLDRESRTATSTNQTSHAALNRLAAEFQALKNAVSLSEEVYRSALSSLEATRIETIRKAKSLVVVEPPTQAQTADYPRRIYDLATIFIVCLFLYAIARLIILTVNEHKD